MQLRLLVSSALCGAMTGKPLADGQATVSFLGPDGLPPGVSDCVVQIRGQVAHVMRAAADLVSELSKHPAGFSRFGNASWLSHVGGQPGGESSRAGRGRRRPEEAPDRMDTAGKDTITAVPDSHGGARLASLICRMGCWLRMKGLPVAWAGG